MELLVLTDEAQASPLVPFLEERGVRVRVFEGPPPTAERLRPDAIVVCVRPGGQPALDSLRRRWPGVPVLTWHEEREGDAAHGGGLRRRDAAAARHPGEIAFRLAQLVHGDGTAVGTAGAPGRERDRVA